MDDHICSIISKRNQQGQRKDENAGDNAYEVSDTSTVNNLNTKHNQMYVLSLFSICLCLL